MSTVAETPETTDGDGDAVRSAALSTEKGVLIDMLERAETDPDCASARFKGSPRRDILRSRS